MCIYDGYIYGCYDPKTGYLSRYNIFTQDIENLGDFIFYGKTVMDKNELYHLQYDEDTLFKMTVGEWKPEAVLEGVKSIGMPHKDNGYGVFVYEYRIADAGLIKLHFDKDYKLYKVSDKYGKKLLS